MQIGTTRPSDQRRPLPLSFIIGCDALTIEGSWHVSEQRQGRESDLRNLPLDLNFLVNVDDSNHMIHPDDIPYIKNIIKRFRQGEFIEYHFRLIAAHGEVTPIYGSGKLVTTMVSAPVIEDLEHLLDQDELHLKVYRYAERVTHIGSWTWNLATDELFFSENLYRLLGEDPYAIEVNWQEFSRYFHADDREKVLGFARQIKQNHQSIDVEFRLINIHGQISYVNLKGEYFITAKQRGYFIGTLLDITQSRQTTM